MVNNTVSTSNYTYGNTAVEIKPQIKSGQKKKIVRRRKPKNNLKLKLKLVLSVLLICGFSFLTLLRFASIVNLQGNIALIKKEITKIQSENEDIRVDIALQNNIKLIESEATSKYNMTEPELEDIVYIDVQPLTMSESEGDAATASLFQRLMGLIN